MTAQINKALSTLVALDGVYGARVFTPLGEKRAVIEVDAVPETRWHAQQGSFSGMAKSFDKVAAAVERHPGWPDRVLIDAAIDPFRLRVTVYRINDEAALVVFTQLTHPVSKSLTRSVRQVVPKLLAALAEPLLVVPSKPP